MLRTWCFLVTLCLSKTVKITCTLLACKKIFSGLAPKLRGHWAIPARPVRRAFQVRPPHPDSYRGQRASGFPLLSRAEVHRT